MLSLPHGKLCVCVCACMCVCVCMCVCWAGGGCGGGASMCVYLPACTLANYIKVNLVFHKLTHSSVDFNECC